MNKIIVNELGPISHLNMDLDKDINIIIGPQASGKSTLGKIIYFCKKIRDYYVDFIIQDDTFTKIPPNEIYLSFLKYIRKNFVSYFGTTKHMKPFSILYSYNNSKNVTISLKDGYALFKFSNELETSLRKSFEAAQQLYRRNFSNNSEDIPDYFSDFISKMSFKTEIKRHFSAAASEMFCDDDDIIYIPAGRSLLSVLSEQLDTVDTAILDLPMKEFIDRIRLMKIRFGSRMDSLVDDYLKMVKGQIKNTNIEIAMELIKKILKADYVNSTDSERLYFDDTHWVKLIFSSSGQQESLWILLLLFIVILEDRKSFIIIEEPEAHLYPAAQKFVTELIALTNNSSKSKIFITTHSPYLLTSANLLIHSGIVENSSKIMNEKPVIKKQLRILPHKVIAYKISETMPFTFLPIIDEESGMIDSLSIDTVSNIINTEAEKLTDLEIKYDL